MSENRAPGTKSSKTKPEGENRWVKSIGRDWAVSLEAGAGCSLGIVFLVLAISSIWHRVFWLPLIPVLLFAAIYPFAKHVFFHRVVCPYCGYNPTRRKSDGAPRKDHYKVLAELRRLDVCPSCGQAGPRAPIDSNR